MADRLGPQNVPLPDALLPPMPAVKSAAIALPAEPPIDREKVHLAWGCADPEARDMNIPVLATTPWQRAACCSTVGPSQHDPTIRLLSPAADLSIPGPRLSQGAQHQ